MTNWKKLKITKEPASSSFGNISFELSEFVPYKHEGRIDWLSSINCVDGFPFNSYQVGDYIEVDIDKTRNYKFVHYFDDINIVRKVSSSTNIISTSGSSSNIVISPSAVNAMNSPGAMDLARRMSEMVDATGKEYEFKIEDPNSKLNYSLICRKGS